MVDVRPGFQALADAVGSGRVDTGRGRYSDHGLMAVLKHGVRNHTKSKTRVRTVLEQTTKITKLKQLW